MTKRLDIDKLKKRGSKFDYKSIFIDWVSFTLSDEISYFDSIITNTNFTNSNFIFDIFTNKKGETFGLSFQKTQTRNGPAIIMAVSVDLQTETGTIQGFPVPFGSYLMYDENTTKLTKKFGLLSFYGSYFELEKKNIGFDFLDYLIETGYLPKNTPCSRVDIRSDFCSKNVIPMMKKNLISEVYKNTGVSDFAFVSHSKGWQTTGFSIGDRENKTLFLRVYDKKIDTNKKKKRGLYSHYNEFKTVHRVEVELGRKRLQGINAGNFRKLINIFDDLNYLPELEYKNGPIIVDQRYIKTYFAYARGIYQSGACPETLLKDNQDMRKIKDDYLKSYHQQQKLTGSQGSGGGVPATRAT